MRSSNSSAESCRDKLPQSIVDVPMTSPSEKAAPETSADNQSRSSMGDETHSRADHAGTSQPAIDASLTKPLSTAAVTAIGAGSRIRDYELIQMLG